MATGPVPMNSTNQDLPPSPQSAPGEVPSDTQIQRAPATEGPPPGMQQYIAQKAPPEEAPPPGMDQYLSGQAPTQPQEQFGPPESLSRKNQMLADLEKHVDKVLGTHPDQKTMSFVDSVKSSIARLPEDATRMGVGMAVAGAAEPAIAASGPYAPLMAAGAFGFGYMGGDSLVHLAKRILDVKDPETRGPLIDAAQSFIEGTTGAMQGMAVAHMARTGLPPNLAQRPPEPPQPPEPPSAAGIPVGEDAIRAQQDQRVQLSKDTGLPLTADQVQGQVAPQFKTLSDQARMAAYREYQKQQLGQKFDEIRSTLQAPGLTDEAMNKGASYFKGIEAYHENQIKEPLAKANVASGDRTYFNTGNLMKSWQSELSKYGAQFDEVGNMIKPPAKDQGMSLLASRYEAMQAKLSGGESALSERGSGIPNSGPYAPPGSDLGSVQFQQSIQPGTIGASPKNTPIINMEGKYTPPGQKPGSYNPSVSEAGDASRANLPPNQGGSPAKGVTLQELNKLTRDAQEFANLKAEDRTPIERSWGKIQYEARLARDESASQALELRGNPGDAAKLRRARNFYANHIDTFNEISDALAKDPTNIGMLIDKSNPAVSLPRIAFLNRMDPEILKTVRGGFLDSLLREQPNLGNDSIDPATKTMGAATIERNINSVDPKIMRALFGESGTNDLRKLIEIGKIYDKTPGNMIDPANATNLAKLVGLLHKSKIRIGKDTLLTLFSKQASPNDYINHNLAAYLSQYPEPSEIAARRAPPPAPTKAPQKALQPPGVVKRVFINPAMQGGQAFERLTRPGNR